TGEDVTSRVTEQAWLFGANIVITAAAGLAARGAERVVRLADGSDLAARAVIIATGVTWRRLGVPALEALVGAGVFYGAAGAEAHAMAGHDVYVIGAGNSAGQAALHLAKYAASVTMVIRGAGLSATMSSYLVTEISKTANITVRVDTEVTGGEGQCSLELLTLRQRRTGAREPVAGAALWVMMGPARRPGGRGGAVRGEGRGSFLPGRARGEGGGAEGWRRGPPPLLLETSMPGVFAAGD